MKTELTKEELKDAREAIIFAVNSPKFCRGVGFKSSPGMLILKIEKELNK